jgi:hypothetical protein
VEPVLAIIAAIAASFAVAYCTEAEGDGDDDPVAGGLLLVVCPQAVTSTNAEDRPDTASNLKRDIFPAA